jgi:hypothetical protein
MPPRSKVTVSVQPAKHRPTSAERRAAQVEMVSGKQADLKREAAERRAKRALRDDADGSESAPSPNPGV